jgi:hypothetical protein
VLIYRYFGGLPELLAAFARRSEFWPDEEELLREVPPRAGMPAIAAGTLKALLRGLRSRPMTQEVLRWELSASNDLTGKLAAVREEQSLRPCARSGSTATHLQGVTSRRSRRSCPRASRTWCFARPADNRGWASPSRAPRGGSGSRARSISSCAEFWSSAPRRASSGVPRRALVSGGGNHESVALADGPVAPRCLRGGRPRRAPGVRRSRGGRCGTRIVAVPAPPFVSVIWKGWLAALGSMA